MKTSFLNQKAGRKNEMTSIFWNSDNTDSSITTWNAENEEYDSNPDLTEKMAEELLAGHSGDADPLSGHIDPHQG